ncbi:probable serine/threonine-protein kinase DDB_G0278665 isoform X1 [Varroa jacobsoni]|uniref:probable serine/threonine-protein kinase DDB_G0278665 isoform X1 n=1 Tax=Varroa jacobsoni TaxID=62625 RepID=UPI000BF97861|nr:probable serine/threonine-protein kinase DDB_G0278665 isoform X1 [Varroa jacobsoni]
MAKVPHGIPRSSRTPHLDASGLSMPPSPTSHYTTERRRRYVHELPYNAHSKLCKLLDVDRKWDHLAGLMDIETVDIKLFANAVLRGGSPSEEVLKKFGERNGRISQLFKYLHAMEYYKGMHILKDYVDPRHWRLLGAGNSNGDASSTLLSGHFEPPSAPPYESEQMLMKPKLQVDSRNVYSPCKEGYLKGHDSKLPSSTANRTKEIAKLHGAKIAKAAAACAAKPGRAELDRFHQELLSSGIKVLSLKPQVTQKDSSPVKLHDVNMNAEINFKDIDLEPIRHIAYAELAKATQNFAKNNMLGKGGFGTVYRGLWKDTTVAVKKLHLSTQPGNREHVRQVPSPSRHPEAQPKSEAHLLIRSMLTELRVLEKCRFPHILALYGVSVDNLSESCIVYEFMSGGSLDDRLKRKQNFASVKPLTWHQRASIAIGTARGLNYLHTADMPLVHGDIKPANILLDENLQPKLGDFGLTREGPDGGCTHRDVSRLQGTRYYLPLEYLQSRHLSTKVDVYSFGLVLLELATNLRVCDETRRHRFLSSHIDALKAFGRQLEAKDPTGGDEPGSNDIVELFLNLGRRCASENKKQRPEMREVLDELKDALTFCKPSPLMGTGYSRESTATMHHAGTAGWAQGMCNGGQIVPQNLRECGEIRRLSPSDNLQVGPLSSLPPAGTTPPTGTGNNTAIQQLHHTPQGHVQRTSNHQPSQQQQYPTHLQVQHIHMQKLQNAQYQQLYQNYHHLQQQSQQQHLVRVSSINSSAMPAKAGAVQPTSRQIVGVNHPVSNTTTDELNQIGPSAIISTPSNNNTVTATSANQGTETVGTRQSQAPPNVAPSLPCNPGTTGHGNSPNVPIYEVDSNCLPLVPALNPDDHPVVVPQSTIQVLSEEELTTKSTNTTNNSISTSSSSADNSPN